MTALHRRDHDHNAAIHFPIQKPGNTLGYWPHTLEPSIQESLLGLPANRPSRGCGAGALVTEAQETQGQTG